MVRKILQVELANCIYKIPDFIDTLAVSGEFQPLDLFIVIEAAWEAADHGFHGVMVVIDSLYQVLIDPQISLFFVPDELRMALGGSRALRHTPE